VESDIAVEKWQGLIDAFTIPRVRDILLCGFASITCLIAKFHEFPD
jgi:hypothetical protein